MKSVSQRALTVEDIRRFYFPTPIDWVQIDPNIYGRLLNSAEIHNIAAKSLLFREGDHASSVYIIRSGRVKAHQSTPYGSDQVLFLFTSGDFFGYRPLLSKQPQPFSITALEETQVWQINGSEFEQILYQSPSFLRWMIVSLCNEFSALTERITAFTQYPVKVRVALALLILEQKYQDPVVAGTPVDIRLSRTNLAQYVGTSIETLVRTLAQFAKAGYVKLTRQSIRVIDPHGLETLLRQ